jgi:hypothetical protein
MKKIILLVFLAFITFQMKGQTISSEKILEYLSKHNLSYIQNDLKKYGFKHWVDAREDLTQDMFEKGSETISISRQNMQGHSVFVLVYITSTKDYYNKLKSNFMLDDMKYMGSDKNGQYYGNKLYMLGINDVNKVISFFIKTGK